MSAPAKAPLVGSNGLITSDWLNYFATLETGGGVSSFTNVTINRTSSGVSITVATDAAALTGDTLASNVVNSSLTGVGTLTSGGLGAGFVLGLSVVTLSGSLPWANLPAGAGNWSATPTVTGTLTVASDIAPLLNYTSNLGSINKKLLAIYAAELWVETLVAADTMATIGGRVLVAPTTELTVDLAAAGTSITVKHNNLLNGHRVRLEANGQVEWMAITSVASGSAGAYVYSVTRNLDGSGANDWPAGSAVLSTGTTGDGFIDLYSVSGVLSGSGPTIVGNVRTGTTYNQIEPRWAIGNLNGLFGYASTEYGAAFGVPSAAWIKIDPTNGVRMGYNTTTKVQVSPSGAAVFSGPDITLGTSSAFDSASALKLTRPSGIGFGQAGDVYSLWGQAVAGDTFIFLENTIKGVGVGSGGSSGKASVYLVATGWDNTGAGSATAQAYVRARSEVGLCAVVIGAEAFQITSPTTGAFLTVSANGVTQFGGQIAFPSTQNPSADANTFDDYEESTWTPGLLINGSSAGIAYTSRSGHYTKKGDEVTLYGEVLLSNKGASVGAATITGLPFSGGTPIAVGCFQAVGNLTGLTAPHVTISGSTLFLLDVAASVSAQIADTNLTNTSWFRFTVTYKV